MKKLFLLPLFVLSALLFSCSDSDDPTQTPPPDPFATYEGTISIDDTPCDVSCDVDFDDTYSSCDFTINGLQFPGMPVSVNIKLPSLPCYRTGDEVKFESASPIVPLINVTRAFVADSTYTVEKFRGTLRGSELNFEIKIASMGEFTFEGNEAVNDTVTVPSDSTYIPDAPVDSIYTPDAPVDSTYTPDVPSIRPVIIPDGTLQGSLDVVASDSSTFVCENVECQMVANTENETCDLYIRGAKFAQAMPVTINILLKGLPYSSNEGYATFSARDIVPCIEYPGAGYVESEEYKFYSIDCIFKGGELRFSADMTRGSFSFRGM